MKVLIKETLSKHKFKDLNGYLICTDCILARTGKQSYRKNEVFATDDISEIEIDRPYEEVFDAKTLASFENVPLCKDHPDEDVTPENHNSYSVGFVRNIRQGKDNNTDVIIGDLVITDSDVIELVENGEYCELSCGYNTDIIGDDREGYKQTNIRGNHVALCQQGRAGNARIVDSKLKLNYSRLDSFQEDNLKSKFSNYHVKFSYNRNGDNYILDGKKEDIIRAIKNIFGSDTSNLKFDDSVKDAQNYTINFRNDYEGFREKIFIKANSAIEALKEFSKNVILNGWGTRNVTIISVSPNDGNMRLYGNLYDLIKSTNDSVKDELYSLQELKEMRIGNYKESDIYKVNGKYSTNPNTSHERFNSLEEVKKYIDNKYSRDSLSSTNEEVTKSLENNLKNYEVKNLSSVKPLIFSDNIKDAGENRIFELGNKRQVVFSTGNFVAMENGVVYDKGFLGGSKYNNGKGWNVDDYIKHLKSLGYKEVNDSAIKDANKNITDIINYFKVWGYPSRSELQQVVDFYRLTKSDIQTMNIAFNNHYSNNDLNKLTYHDSIIKDIDVNRVKEILSNYNNYVSKLKMLKSKLERNELRLNELKYELNSYYKYNASYGSAKSSDRTIDRLKKEIENLNFEIEENKEDIFSLETMLKEAKNAEKSIKDNMTSKEFDYWSYHAIHRPNDRNKLNRIIDLFYRNGYKLFDYDDEDFDDELSNAYANASSSLKNQINAIIKDSKLVNDSMKDSKPDLIKLFGVCKKIVLNKKEVK